MTNAPSAPSPSPQGVVVVGASAGGIEALRGLLGLLPADLPAAVLVTLHLGAETESALDRILARACDLEVKSAVDGAPLDAGVVYAARPDYHLLVRDGRVRLGRGPRENGHRPAVDPLFRSAARWYGPRVTAVVLSGALDDGAAGALAVASHGGAVLVQDPDEAMYGGMPEAVRRAVPDAVCASLRDLAEIVTRRAVDLQNAGVDRSGGSVPTRLLVETDIAELEGDALMSPDPPGRPSGLACPDCHGVLFEIDDGSLLRYRCRVGHAWSPESLVVEQSEELESALWMGLRALEDRSALHRKLAGNARDAGRPRMAAMSEDRASEADRSAEVIRELLLELGGRPGDDDG